MNAATNLFRRGAVYYFRRRLRWPDGTTSGISISLRTRRLALARERAIGLAARCEQLRRRLGMSGENSLSHDQRRAIFNRQLTLERDRLDALHSAVLELPNDDVWPQRHSDEFPLQLETMEQVCRDWIVHGCPANSHFTDLESYLEHNFASQVDELDRVYLLGGLGSLETLGQLLDEGARHALAEVGAPATDENTQSALRAIFSAKLRGLAAYRESLSQPDLAYNTSLWDTQQRRTEGPFPLPEWPYSHLLDVDPGSWVSDRPPCAERPAASPKRQPEAACPSDWAGIGIVAAGERYLEVVKGAG